MAEKKATKKEATVKEVEAKKPAAKKCASKCACVTFSAETAGFKAGDVYQALAGAEKALDVKEIAKAAGISESETLVGMGWLFKEGKIASADNKYTLA